MKKNLLLLVVMIMAAVSVSAREVAKTYNGIIYQGDGYLQSLPYGEDGQYAITVTLSADKGKITLNNWLLNEGDDAVNLELTFDNTKTQDNITLINGEEEDPDYGTVWIDTPNVEDDGYYGIWAYPSYSQVYLKEDNSGYGNVCMYSYAQGGYTWVYFQWFVDDETGISTVLTDTTNTPAYNISGMRVADNFKGIRIQNGKKFVR